MRLLLDEEIGTGLSLVRDSPRNRAARAAVTEKEQ
jgi:hypothetical protein